MLLRSSSSPVLECLLPPLVSCHTEPSPDSSKHESQAPEPVLPKSLSLSPSTRGITSSPITTCLPNFDPHLHVVHGPSSSGIRKVLSENDLYSLTAGSSSTPARFAANSLLHDDNADSCPSLDPSRSHLRKSRVPSSSRWWRPPGSELPSVCFDSNSAILEEGELPSSNSSIGDEEEEERGRSICVIDKLGFPVGDTPNVEAEGVKKTDDEYFKCDMMNESWIWQSTSAKSGMEGVEGEERGIEAKHGANTVFSGRQEVNHLVGQGTSCLLEGGAPGTIVLAPQLLGQVSQQKYAYHGDAREMTLGAGGGGRGARPPTSSGGGGGGGEAGGHGGRNSDPTELHYQSILKADPGHPLILQNYAQYLAEVKCDFGKAEEFFQRAILANPSDGELLCQYANLLWEVKQDRERAATYFERAVQAAPDNSYVMAAYASFLWSAEDEEEESVEQVKRSNPANVPASVFSLISTGPL